MPQRWYWRLIWSAVIRQRRSRTVLIAAALGAGVLAAMASLYLGMGFQLSEDLRAYGANLTITPAEQGALLAEERMAALLAEERLARALAALDPAERAASATYLEGPVTLTRPGAVRLTREVRALLIGAEGSDYAAVKPYLMVEGRWPERSGEVLVGVEVAADLKLEPGEQVAVTPPGGKAAVLTVSGLVISGGAEDDQVVVPLAIGRAILDRPEGLDGALVSLRAAAPRLAEIATRITEADPAMVATPRGQLARAEEKVHSRLQSLFLLLTAVIGVSAILCLFTTMVAMVSERHEEIGLKKALGASVKRVCREFLTEAAVLGLGGALLGLALGAVLSRVVGQVAFGAPQSIDMAMIPVTLLITPVVTMLAAWRPVSRLARIRPVSALRRESQ